MTEEEIVILICEDWDRPKKKDKFPKEANKVLSNSEGWSLFKMNDRDMVNNKLRVF